MIDTMDKHSCELFLEDALEIGRRLVETGAEVKRVEDTVRRICIAYGFTDCEIYAVTSLIVATIRDKDGNHYTQSVRVQSYGTDLGRLEELNAFSRRICAQVPDVEDLTRQIRQYKKGKPKPVIKCLGYMLAAGGFSVFYGGDLKDGLAAAAIAIVIYLMDYHLKLRQIHNVIHLCGRVRLRAAGAGAHPPGLRSPGRQNYDRRHYVADPRSAFSERH